ncbi:MAG TPA: DUF5916 domain-containing protein [Thermoanaerobaculia bacterium]|nr:DUF5916 domain-containing protein [Thermoanaerobaculia bacterium]
MNNRSVVALAILLCLTSVVLCAQVTNDPIQIHRASGPITIDAQLSEEAWKDASRIDKWYETNPGDNIEPKAKSIGWLAYDDHFLYAAFQFDDPQPSKISASFNDHDRISGNVDDYAGVILDTRNDRKTGVLLLTTARGVQYDAISDDSTGEDSAPDYFWDSAARITSTGWILEMRVPFSSLRYDDPNPAEWGIMLYRNMPRDRRYQMFANRIPRGNNCFICTRNPLIGLQGLPAGGHLVAAPYVSAREVGTARNEPGDDFVNRPVGGDAGLDLKWTPNADTAIDGTINPDFSQVESDVAVISTNERFAIFFDEKRPFFLEGIDLMKTPIQAVYTRTITAPRWGARSTGRFGGNIYTALIAQDRGGGSVILPTPEGSGFADQNHSSYVAIGRVRRPFGKRASFMSFLVSARENEGGAHNRVFGPDFEWRPTAHDTITGQLLFSDTVTPNEPELAEEWDGRSLKSHAFDLWWQHSTEKHDLFVQHRDFGDDFRADNGFVPQVGFRLDYAEAGRTYRPKGFFSRIRAYTFAEYDSKQDGSLLYRGFSSGVGMDGKFRSFTRLRYAYENVRSGDDVFLQHRLFYTIQFGVNNVLTQVSLDGWVGQGVDFANNRLGNGASFSLTGSLRPNPHLEFGLTNSFRWLNVHDDRLFTSQVERVRATYTFNSRMFIRTIVQNERTNRDRNLYTFDVSQHSGSLATQLLLAYKLNWQTVMYVGYGGLREVVGSEGDLEPSERQFFAKVSYAFQR